MRYERHPDALTPEGHTIVEAAHIVPWNESRDDRPGNEWCSAFVEFIGSIIDRALAVQGIE